jgi:hypothetical protein
MSNPTFTSVALDVVGQYNQAGKQLVRAYRAGSERVVRNVNERFAAALDARPLPLVSPEVKSSLIGAQQMLAGLVSTGIAAGTGRADAGIDGVARSVKNGIEGLAGARERIGNAFDVSALDSVGTLALPLAQVSLEIAHRVARGSRNLSERIAGEEIAVAPAKPAAQKRGARVQRARRA